MKFYGGKHQPGKKTNEEIVTTPLTPEEQAKQTRLERRKKVARQRQLMLAGGITLAAIAIIALLFNIFVRPPDVSTNSTEVATDANGNIILPTDGQPSLTDGEDHGDRKKDYYTFLLCGLDQDKTRADTIMAVSYDVPNGIVNVIVGRYVKDVRKFFVNIVH